MVHTINKRYRDFLGGLLLTAVGHSAARPLFIGGKDSFESAVPGERVELVGNGPAFHVEVLETTSVSHILQIIFCVSIRHGLLSVVRNVGKEQSRAMYDS